MTKRNRRPRIIQKPRLSLKGLRGHVVGAPPKNVRFPNRKFTMAELFTKNLDISHVTIRNRVTDCLPTKQQGTNALQPRLFRLPDQKTPKGKVGAKPAIYILKSHYNREMGLWRPEGRSLEAIKIQKPKKVIKLSVAASPTPIAEAVPISHLEQTPEPTAAPLVIPAVPTVTDNASASVVG